MKKLFFIMVFILTSATTFAQVFVKGYTKSNGTYVHGHYRTPPPEKYSCSTINNIANSNPYLKKEESQSRTQYIYNRTNSREYYTICSDSISINNPTNITKTGSVCGQYYIKKYPNKNNSDN